MNSSGFWANNFSKMNVSLSDLNVTIPAKKSVNLLKYFPLEKLEESKKTGSLFRKKDKIVISYQEPIINSKENIKLYDGVILKPLRSVVKTDETPVEDLLFSDEQFAEDLLKMDDED